MNTQTVTTAPGKQSNTAQNTMNWHVYMILCSDKSLYTGISNNVPKRYQQHLRQQGAKYFRGRQPLQLVYVEDGHDRCSASKREKAIKKLKRTQKLALIAGANNRITQMGKNK